MRLRRDRDDNADLSDEEHAWWTGRDRRKEAGEPPTGMGERRQHDTLILMTAPPPPPPPPPLPPPAPAPTPATPSSMPAPAVALPTLVPASGPVVLVSDAPAADAFAAGPDLPPAELVPPTPPPFPFEREVSGVPDVDPADDPWHRSTSPQVLAAYRTLGIDWEASWDEVVEVFRDHAALWHPDRLAGTDPLVQAEGQRRMSEMNRAYAELKRILRPSRRELFSS